MKLIFTIAFVGYTSVAFAAIEFSEDQVSATTNNAPQAVTSTMLTTGSGTAAAPMITPSMPTAAMGAMNQAQSLVVPRQAPTPMPQSAVGGMGMAGMGGGGGARGQGVIVMMQPGPATGGTPAPGGMGGTSGPAPNAIPEPGTLAVWSVLGLLGFAFLRRRFN